MPSIYKRTRSRNSAICEAEYGAGICRKHRSGSHCTGGPRGLASAACCWLPVAFGWDGGWIGFRALTDPCKGRSGIICVLDAALRGLAATSSPQRHALRVPGTYASLVVACSIHRRTSAVAMGAARQAFSRGFDQRSDLTFCLGACCSVHQRRSIRSSRATPCSLAFCLDSGSDQLATTVARPRRQRDTSIAILCDWQYPRRIFVPATLGIDLRDLAAADHPAGKQLRCNRRVIEGAIR